MVYGSGFVDILKKIGSYLFENKDLIAKPLLEAVGEVGGLALTEGSKALIKKLSADNKKKELDPSSKEILDRLVSGSGIKKKELDPTSKEILDRLVSGSGIKKKKKELDPTSKEILDRLISGSGVKKF